jgi:hypothetical protein
MHHTFSDLKLSQNHSMFGHVSVGAIIIRESCVLVFTNFNTTTHPVFTTFLRP